mgnify:CR=1 FL=1
MFVPANFLSNRLRIKVADYDDSTFYVFYDGIRVGIIKGDKYITRRNADLHYFRKYDGYGISKAILELLKTLMVYKIVIIEEGDKGERLLVSSIHDWFENGLAYDYKLPNGDIDTQIVLPVRFMERVS